MHYETRCAGHQRSKMRDTQHRVSPGHRDARHNAGIYKKSGARGAVNHPANSCDDRHAICVEIESAMISAPTKAREDSVSR
jgi:hypothetical protein